MSVLDGHGNRDDDDDCAASARSGTSSENSELFAAEAEEALNTRDLAGRETGRGSLARRAESLVTRDTRLIN